MLAGDENFSDEKIIGKDSREVQEQLAAVWIHENADLAGMKKAEVETVKAYASRQVDRARPAYGHFLKQQPRHSIEVGTTNGDEYLQSQTGNRRFWPMTVLKAIDLEKLKKDRLQLWGEAAHYQSKGEALTIDEAMWPDAGVEQEKRRVKDPWEAVLANMPEVVEKKRWDQEAECYVVTKTHRIIHLVIGDQERVASAGHPDPRPRSADSPPDDGAHDAARERDEGAGLAANVKRQGHDQRPTGARIFPLDHLMPCGSDITTGVGNSRIADLADLRSAFH